ncbi:thioredoxin-disulfide reductase [soil metagenome]
MQDVFDSIIIGAGPAGLTTAIYLARFNRKTLVIDKNSGRSSYLQVNENYLGFPEGIHAHKLRDLGKIQAEKFGTLFVDDEIMKIKKIENLFEVSSLENKFFAKSLVLATGVVDIFPAIPRVKSYFGISLFWCITCDGYKTQDKKVIILGHTDDAVVTCLQFLTYTKKLIFLLNCDIESAAISQRMKDRLEEHNIPYNEGVIEEFIGDNGHISEVVLKGGNRLSADYVFSEQGASPNSVLAKELDVKTDANGYIYVTKEQRTNVPFIYAAGDVTRIHSHQVVTAAHEGSQAAQSANYDLYEPFQKD